MPKPPDGRAGATPAAGFTLEAIRGQWVPVEARNPASVCCDEALLVCALRSVGVPLHPAFPFSSTIEEIGDGLTLTLWRWLLAPKSADGLYKTADLIAAWDDPRWAVKNPKHEFALAATVARNMGIVAAEVRERVPRAIVRRGKDTAYIPANASPARREWIIARLEGRLPLNAPFVEPVPVPEPASALHTADAIE